MIIFDFEAGDHRLEAALIIVILLTLLIFLRLGHSRWVVRKGYRRQCDSNSHTAPHADPVESSADNPSKVVPTPTSISIEVEDCESLQTEEKQPKFQAGSGPSLNEILQSSLSQNLDEESEEEEDSEEDEMI